MSVKHSLAGIDLLGGGMSKGTILIKASLSIFLILREVAAYSGSEAAVAVDPEAVAVEQAAVSVEPADGPKAGDAR